MSNPYTNQNSQPKLNNQHLRSRRSWAAQWLIAIILSIVGILIGQWIVRQVTVYYMNRTPLVMVNRPDVQVYVCPDERRDVYTAMTAGYVTSEDNGISQKPADPILLQQMTKEGRVYGVDQGTQVRWLTSEGDCAKVQIMDGPDKGREGWVYDQWVIPQ